MSFSGVVIEAAMNVTFPALMSEFSVDTATVQWMTTSYLLVLAAIVPTSSYLNRRFPTRRVFVTAMVFYIAGIVCGFTAQSFPMLLTGRVLEGIGTQVTAMAPAVKPQTGADDMAAATMAGTREAYLLLAVIMVIPLAAMGYTLTRVKRA